MIVWLNSTRWKNRFAKKSRKTSGLILRWHGVRLWRGRISGIPVWQVKRAPFSQILFRKEGKMDWYETKHLRPLSTDGVLLDVTQNVGPGDFAAWQAPEDCTVEGFQGSYIKSTPGSIGTVGKVYLCKI